MESSINVTVSIYSVHYNDKTISYLSDFSGPETLKDIPIEHNDVYLVAKSEGQNAHVSLLVSIQTSLGSDKKESLNIKSNYGDDKTYNSNDSGNSIRNASYSYRSLNDDSSDDSGIGIGGIIGAISGSLVGLILIIVGIILLLLYLKNRRNSHSSQPGQESIQITKHSKTRTPNHEHESHLHISITNTNNKNNHSVQYQSQNHNQSQLFKKQGKTVCFHES